MRDRDTPLKLVRLWPARIQGCYEQLDLLAGAKEDETVWWPDYCRLPVNATVTYLQKSGMDKRRAAVMASFNSPSNSSSASCSRWACSLSARSWVSLATCP